MHSKLAPTGAQTNDFQIKDMYSTHAFHTPKMLAVAIDSSGTSCFFLIIYLVSCYAFVPKLVTQVH